MSVKKTNAKWELQGLGHKTPHYLMYVQGEGCKFRPVGFDNELDQSDWAHDGLFKLTPFDVSGPLSAYVKS